MPDIEIPASFHRTLQGKPAAMRTKVMECVARLQVDPSDPKLHTKKMGGQRTAIWEARVDYANRVTFEWVGAAIFLRNNCNHDMLTRNP